MKPWVRLLIFPLLLAVFLACPKTAAAFSKYSLADVNRDGIIDSGDSSIVNGLYTEINPTGQAASADINQNGEIDILDIGLVGGHYFTNTSACQRADLDNDIDVDSTDLATLQGYLNQTANSTNMPADLNYDGTINSSDEALLNSVIGCSWISATLNSFASYFTTSNPSFTGIATTVYLGTEGKISSISYSLDGAAWTTSGITVTDGTIDEYEETFSLTFPTSLTNGNHTLQTKTTTTDNTVSIITDYIIRIDPDDPVAPTLNSPVGYTNSDRPILVFTKGSDAVSGIGSYTVALDPGKNQNWSTTGIPLSGSNQAYFIWKDDTNTKIEFFNENDSDSGNDQVKVYFKGLASSPLTEGKHLWQGIANDNAGHSKEESKEFYLDQTSPTLSNLTIAGLDLTTEERRYVLKSDQRLPIFSGLVTDTYRGSTKSNSNSTSDSFEKVASGPKTITLSFKKLKAGLLPLAGNNFENYSSQNYNLTDIKDFPDNKKEAWFSVTPSYPLVDGYYQVEIDVKDAAGNSSKTSFYLSLNYHGLSATAPNRPTTLPTHPPKSSEPSSKASPVQPTPTPETGQLTTVIIKVVDTNGQPVVNARVELYSKPRVSYTNDQGLAIFENVEQGEHSAKISYANFEEEKSLDVRSNNQKPVNFEVKITKNDSLASLKKQLIASVVGFGIGILLIIYLSFKR